MINSKITSNSKLNKNKLFEELLLGIFDNDRLNNILEYNDFIPITKYYDMFYNFLKTEINILEANSFNKLFYLSIIILKKNLILLKDSIKDFNNIINYKLSIIKEIVGDNIKIYDIENLLLSYCPKNNIFVLHIKNYLLNLFLKYNFLLYSLFELNIQNKNGSFIIDHPKYYKYNDVQLGTIKNYTKGELDSKLLDNNGSHFNFKINYAIYNDNCWFNHISLLSNHYILGSKKDNISLNKEYIDNEISSIKNQINFNISEKEILNLDILNTTEDILDPKNNNNNKDNNIDIIKVKSSNNKNILNNNYDDNCDNSETKDEILSNLLNF